MPSVWRSRDFKLVMAAGTINDIGDWMLSLALPFYVFTETGSGRTTALVFLIELLVGVACGPFGGALVDRWNLRRVIIATNARTRTRFRVRSPPTCVMLMNRASLLVGE